ncbi:18088_t:CDS:2 [Funneliformis geosporum]|uniref:19139_t:CDS:1 n=1 Tax=Funneliformis geosporum TaxID=1117311 RepID=A0A9W4SNZ5_9GLOM|nr:18088_t:CDS:2 [Funneliformis geosporum]CAI2176356.1 19139_t:CDS:2 [Funneliformis geosporum]
MSTIIDADKSEIRLLTELNSRLKEENELLKIRVKELEEKLEHNSKISEPTKSDKVPAKANLKNNDLSLDEYTRYGRQLILPGFGKSGQLKLKNTSILIVGAGGLGAPVAIYLAAAGVGKLGIIDYDTVEKSNLQRQVIHNESREGVSKAQSARMTIEELNSLCQCVAYDILLDSSNALEIIEKYDIVIDATDNVATRYLLNDACVMAGIPLVSGSALRMDGQLTIYNYKGGPCYRCLFPKPPPPESVLNCSDGGVLGVVTGVIGCLQALQAIKIATDMNGGPHNLLIFSATSYPLFRSMKLRPKKEDCALCGERPSITELIDYVQFCGSGALDKSPTVNVLGYEDRIEPKVRKNLPNSINIPLNDLPNKIEEVKKSLEKLNTPGNDSQHAVNILKNVLKGEIKDIIGGLYKWSLDVDQEFPIY